MTSDGGAPPNFLRASLELFAFAFPFTCVVRFIAEWLFAESNAAYFAWLQSDWKSELVVSLVFATLMSLGLTYERRREYWKDYEKRDNRYEP